MSEDKGLVYLIVGAIAIFVHLLLLPITMKLFFWLAKEWTVL